MKQIEIELTDGKKVPFFTTIRSKVLFARGRFKIEDLLEGNMDAIVYSAYCIIVGACKRNNVQFDLDYEAFIDVCPENIDQVFEMLRETEKEPDDENTNTEYKKKPEMT